MFFFKSNTCQFCLYCIMSVVKVIVVGCCHVFHGILTCDPLRSTPRGSRSTFPVSCRPRRFVELTWRLTWSVMWSERANTWLQTVQRYGLSPVCFRMWRVSSSERAKRSRQPSSGHWNGFSPVWQFKGTSINQSINPDTLLLAYW